VDGLLERFDRFRVPLQQVQGDAEVELEEEVLRLDACRYLQGGSGLLEAAGEEAGARQAVVGVRALVVVLGEAQVERLGAVDVTRLEQLISGPHRFSRVERRRGLLSIRLHRGLLWLGGERRRGVPHAGGGGFRFHRGRWGDRGGVYAFSRRRRGEV